ncbi:MAG: NAD-dependent epimerase/dehydratase family protein [Gallionella sp.]
MTNVLITGGAGFIGSNLALALIRKGYAVTVLDNLSPQIHGDYSPLFESIKEKVTFVLGDVRNKADWANALRGQDAVIHLAAETGTGQSMYEAEKYVDVNVRGTAVLLDLLANSEHSVQKVIVASSRAIYGEGKYVCTDCGDVYPKERLDMHMSAGDFEAKCPICNRAVDPQGTDESSRIHPSSVYGITKQTQEQMVLVCCKALNIPAVAFRYQNVYGPGQSLSNPYTGILSIFSTRIKNANDIAVFEDGNETRDFVYIDDVVGATILGLESRSMDWDVYNVGSGQPVSVLTVAETLRSAYGSKIGIAVTGNYRLGDIRHNFADLSKVSSRLGFSPLVSFSEGIGRFADWVNEQRIEADNSDASLNEMRARNLYKESKANTPARPDILLQPNPLIGKSFPLQNGEIYLSP